MKNSTQYKVGQFYTFRNESPSKITEVRCNNFTFIVLENGNTISVCK